MKPGAPCFVFDIDGTIADISHRLHLIDHRDYNATTPKQWDEFFARMVDDKPIEHMRVLVDTLSLTYPVLLCTGRGEENREQTVEWLKRHRFNFFELFMRPAGDFRQDDVVKSELLDRMLAEGYAPMLVFEDRARVVKMWRSRGIPCAQVAEAE